MEYRPPKYLFPIPGTAWSQGVGQPAGVFYLDGRCHFATHDSPAAERLLEQGALLIGRVRFDAEPSEGRRLGLALETIRPARQLRRFALLGRN